MYDDVTNKLSYENLNFWKKYMKTYYGSIPISVTIGNKIGLQKYIRFKKIVMS